MNLKNSNESNFEIKQSDIPTVTDVVSQEEINALFPSIQNEIKNNNEDSELFPPILKEIKNYPPQEEWALEAMEEKPPVRQKIKITPYVKPNKLSYAVPLWFVIFTLVNVAYAIMRDKGVDFDCKIFENNLHCSIVEKPAPWHD